MRLTILFVFLLFSFKTYSQTDNPSEIDSSLINQEGISFYDQYNPVLGGKAIRYAKKAKCNGWIKDKYPNGKAKHKGLYEKGVLKLYKNFYQNGQLERSFAKKDSKKSILETYYPNGKTRVKASFSFSTPVKWEEYFPNGQLEFIEEYDKNCDYYIQSKFYFENGNPMMILDLEDKKKRLYNYAEYYKNGKLKESGQKIQNQSSGSYFRTGEWKIYNESGKLIRKEHYFKGRLEKEEIL